METPLPVTSPPLSQPYCYCMCCDKRSSDWPHQLPEESSLDYFLRTLGEGDIITLNTSSNDGRWTQFLNCTVIESYTVGWERGLLVTGPLPSGRFHVNALDITAISLVYRKPRPQKLPE